MLEPVKVDMLKTVNCGFLGKAYRTLLNGMCYQGFYGIVGVADSYTIVGIGMWIVIIAMKFTWRIVMDNETEKESYEEQRL